MNILNLEELESQFPAHFSEAQKAQAKTLFYKRIALEAHRFYSGKMQTLPKAPIYGFNWFNVWYTPGVSAVSTAIREENDQSFHLSNRANMVAVVSDSTRVLGDGDCTAPGGLGVMEGKAMLMKYLGGVDAVPMCIDSCDEHGEHQAEKIIDFVKMVRHSFGAINLEDISQPNCYRVLEELRNQCDIPVWHDDAQGTACVTLAGLLNALKLVGKRLSEVRVVLHGAGAANSSIARLMIADGADPEKLILFDQEGALHRHHKYYRDDPRFFLQWDLCRQTNPRCIESKEEAFCGADVVIALSKPGPDTLKPEWIASMAEKSIVFACANPVPEIYPYRAKEAGAYIVATGRGDFPNQVNNSICFPAILKGTLLVSSSKITDNMAICAAHSIADFAERQGLSPTHIMPTMMDDELFPTVAADVAMQAIQEGVARKQRSWQEVYEETKQDIAKTRSLLHLMDEQGLIEQFPEETIRQIIHQVCTEIEL